MFGLPDLLCFPLATLKRELQTQQPQVPGGLYRRSLRCETPLKPAGVAADMPGMRPKEAPPAKHVVQVVFHNPEQ